MRFICKIEWHLMSGTSSVSSHLMAQNSLKPSHHRASGHAAHGGRSQVTRNHASGPRNSSARPFGGCCWRIKDREESGTAKDR